MEEYRCDECRYKIKNANEDNWCLMFHSEVIGCNRFVQDEE